ncbi:MAG: hypothetical protein SFU83_12685 [Meiothermus sp.]|nr:hypothetical protein [Meiothermus sp.]
MTAEFLKSTPTIEDPAAAAFLMNPGLFRFFQPFFTTERTLTQAARLLEVKPNVLFYRLKQMLALGIVEVVRTQRRGGRAMPLYRSSFSSCFIPLRATPYADLFSLMRTNDDLLNQHLVRGLARVWDGQAGSWGWHCRIDEFGLLQAREANEEKDWDPLVDSLPATLHHWGFLALTDPQAKAMQRELDEVVRRYSRLSSVRGAARRRLHVIRVGMAPMVRPA